MWDSTELLLPMHLHMISKDVSRNRLNSSTMSKTVVIMLTLLLVQTRSSSNLGRISTCSTKGFLPSWTKTDLDARCDSTSVFSGVPTSVDCWFFPILATPQKLTSKVNPFDVKFYCRRHPKGRDSDQPG